MQETQPSAVGDDCAGKFRAVRDRVAACLRWAVFSRWCDQGEVREGVQVLVKDAARQAANEVRSKYWDGAFPVDPVAIARSLNLDVKFTSMLPGISGAIVVRPGSAQVLIEDSDAYGRKMFMCAHEVGHFLERQAQDDQSYSFVEKRGGEYDLHEFYADEFAGALLMPDAEFRRQERLLGSDYLMASYFGVSPSAVQKRRERLAR